MSRIPKLPVPTSKENRPQFTRNRAMTNVANSLNDAEKKSLLSSHTRTLVRGATVSSMSSIGTKRPAAAPTRSVDVPPKQAKIVPKAPPINKFDFKARFNDLLEKHKVMKNEFSTLKEQHSEISDDYEKIKETIVNTTAENDALNVKLQKSIDNLRQKSIDFEKVHLEFESKKLESEELKRNIEVLSEVADNFRKKSIDFDKLEREHNDLVRRHEALKQENEGLRVLYDHLKKVSLEHERLQIEHKDAQKIIGQNKVDIEALQNILASMYKEQRDLRNTVQDLKGNIRVYCRVRPPLETESTKPLFNLNVLDACSIEVEKVELNSASQSSRKGKQQQSFTFDGIFSKHSSQEDVFAEVSPMIQSALDGYNVCIFAYGQTGSGKTFTMEGGCGSEQYGIIPRAFNMIFTYIEDLKRMGWDLTIKASFLEIYNENIYDLLKCSKEQDPHEIKMVDSKGTDVYVSNLKEEEVKSSHEFIKLMIYAQRNRQTAATLNNERSSRSHSVTQVKIFAINEKRKEKFTSNLNLVDLAGSESGKTTQRMDETKHINRSLSELSKVILSLQTNQSHIPYRNSKLTYLLMPSLGGNSKTLMLVNISQFDECFGETLNSLRFATKVNSCRTVKAKKNIQMVDPS